MPSSLKWNRAGSSWFFCANVPGLVPTYYLPPRGTCLIIWDDVSVQKFDLQSRCRKWRHVRFSSVTNSVSVWIHWKTLFQPYIEYYAITKWHNSLLIRDQRLWQHQLPSIHLLTPHLSSNHSFLSHKPSRAPNSTETIFVYGWFSSVSLWDRNVDKMWINLRKEKSLLLQQGMGRKEDVA